MMETDLTLLRSKYPIQYPIHCISQQKLRSWIFIAVMNDHTKKQESENGQTHNIEETINRKGCFNHK